MEGLTWRGLLAPEYAMTFAEGFLLGALPSLGLMQGIDGAGAIDVRALPGVIPILGASALGLLNGIRSLRNLRAPAPTPRPGDLVAKP